MQLSDVRHILLVFAACLSIGLYAIPTSKSRDTMALLLLCTLTLPTAFLPRTTDPDKAQTAMIFLGISYRTWIDLMVTHPDSPGSLKRFRVDPKTRREEIMDISTEKAVWKRLKWSLDYFVSRRGVGWSWTVNSVPATPPSTHPRRQCALRASRDLIVNYIVWDFVESVWLPPQPFYSSGGRAPGHGSSAARGGWLGLANGVLGIAGIKASISMTYSGLTLLCVGTGLSSAEDWPPLFGSLSSCNTLRSFWSTYWHGLFKDLWASTSSALLRIPLLNPIASSPIFRPYFNLFFAFFMSSLIHFQFGIQLASSRVAPTGKNVPFRGGDPLVFFNCQAVAILCEDLVIAVWRRRPIGPLTKAERDRGVTTWEKVLGWLWLTVWFGVMGKYLTDEAVIYGMAERQMKESGSLWLWGSEFVGLSGLFKGEL